MAESQKVVVVREEKERLWNDDHEAALEQVAEQWERMEKVSDRLKQDHAFVLALMRCARPRDDTNDYSVQAKRRDVVKALRYVSAELRNNKTILLEAASNSLDALDYIGDELRDDRDIALAITKAPEWKFRILEKFSPALRADKEIVFAVVRVDAFSFPYASDELKGDREVAFTAVQQVQDGSMFRYVSDELKGDEELVRGALRQDGHNLQYAAPELKANKEFVREAVQQKGDSFQYASDEIKRDKAFFWDVLDVVDRNQVPLEFASDELKGDKDIVFAAARKHPSFFQHASEELKADRELVLRLVKEDDIVAHFIPNSTLADRDTLFEVLRLVLPQDPYGYTVGELLKKAPDGVREEIDFLRNQFRCSETQAVSALVEPKIVQVSVSNDEGTSVTGHVLSGEAVGTFNLASGLESEAGATELLEKLAKAFDMPAVSVQVILPSGESLRKRRQTAWEAAKKAAEAAAAAYVAGPEARADVELIEAFGHEVQYQGFMSVAWGPRCQPLIHQAAEKGRADVIAALVRNAQAPAVCQLLQLDLDALEERFDESAAKYADGGLNYGEGNGHNAPLHLAAYAGHRAAVVALLEARAHIESRRIDGRTPLIQAAAANKPAVLEALAGFGADVNARDKESTTAYGVAGKRGYTEAMAKLIELRADVGQGR